MGTDFDRQFFTNQLSTNPLWYMQLQPLLQKYFFHPHTDVLTEEERHTRQEIIELTMKLFDEGNILFGTGGENFDKGRKPIDTIVIHHAGRDKSETRKVIEVLHLLRLYAKYYADPEETFYNTPIWSNHFYNGHMTFITYHYLVYADGRVEHILPDSAIGWQAKGAEMNSRSVAICFFAELDHASPTKKAIQAAKDIIHAYPRTKVIPHSESNPATTCPGDQYDGVNGWGKKLLV